MGGTESYFTREEMQDFQELTYLTKREIIKSWTMWQSLVENVEAHDFSKRFPSDLVLQLPQLKVNPFGFRMVRIFSSLDDGQMSFEDFLDMVSVMSSKAPVDVKIQYAFRVYDTNGDGILDVDDLSSIIDLLVKEKLPESDKKALISKILEESDWDGIGISLEEFGHVMTKCPDFSHSFRFTM